MFRRIFLPLLALLGIGFSLFMIYRGMRQPFPPPILFEPPQSPYTHYVAGEGLIESFDENVRISIPFPELITDVYVQAGQQVKKNTPLFKLDTRQVEADLYAALTEVDVARVERDNANIQFSYFEQLNNKNAVSKQEYTQAYYAQQQAEQKLQNALAQAQAVQTKIERSTICAPTDGKILQQNVRIGEFANVNPFDREALIIFGKTNIYQLRINVAEENAWRIVPGSPATAFVRGNSKISIPLKFSYIEPYIVPKDSLTGTDFEKVDTRVLQIIYTFEQDSYPIYVGQLLDVYIEAKPSNIS